MAIKGTFNPDGHPDTTLKYEVVSWWDMQHNQRSASTYAEGNFMRTDRLIVKVTDEDGKTQHVGMHGPFRNKEFIEEVLAYDFGDEGSLIRFIS